MEYQENILAKKNEFSPHEYLSVINSSFLAVGVRWGVVIRPQNTKYVPHVSL